MFIAQPFREELFQILPFDFKREKILSGLNSRMVCAFLKHFVFSLLSIGNLKTDYVSFFTVMLRSSKPKELGTPDTHRIRTEKILHFGYARRRIRLSPHSKKCNQFIQGCTGIWNLPVTKRFIWGRTQILSEWWYSLRRQRPAVGK